ncbi:MAG: alpha-amylase family glycosyl hydrolase [Phycisphaerae bacterium]|nr:alpha-amylase family glycosyl hydrolase [Phycisphaerae bacterium]
MTMRYTFPASARVRFGLAISIVCGLSCAQVAQAVGQVPPWPPTTPVAVVTEDGRATAPPSVEVRQRSDGLWDIRFSLKLDRALASVSVAGTFNNWSRDALPMSRGADGIWRAEAAITPGTVQYKFVLDGTVWLQDPRNSDAMDDNNGGSNSVLRLGALANLTAGTAAIGDGRIEANALGHEPARVMFRQRLPGGAVVVRYRTLHGDVASVELLVRDGTPLPMATVLRADPFQFWEVSLPTLAEHTEYTFHVRDGANVLRDPMIYRLETDAAGIRTPDWAKHAIWYQIMPDRFRNGDKANDPERVMPWTSGWYEPQPSEAASGKGFYEYVFDRLYGGDLQGVRAKLDYLKDLGINAIYFTPVFQSPSLHRYDATSFVHVEEYLGVKGDYASAAANEDLRDPATWTWTGSDKLFLDFLKEAKAKGFRVIIDGVFNHVGTQHPAFIDVRNNGAASPFADWFAIKQFAPFEYEGWAGFGGMPVFRKNENGLASAAAKRHIFDITRRWMDPDGDGDPSNGVDGWRLDVPNEIALPFWTEWRALVKSINPDAYLVGEIWQRADAWVDGKAFDAVMNYPFAEGAIAWIANKTRKITPSELDARLAELRLAYPAEATFVLQNLLDSHDTDRIASMVLNADREYNRDNRTQDGARAYDASRPPEWAYRRVRLLALLQMTYVGAPMIWYGDEVGMWGASDPTNRKPMLWKDLEPYEQAESDRVHDEQLAWYRAVTALRNHCEALRIGAFRTLLVDDEQDVWVFERTLAGARVIVALNASERHADVTLPSEAGGRWREVFSSDVKPPFAPDGRATGARFPTVTIPSVGGRVWIEDQAAGEGSGK